MSFVTIVCCDLFQMQSIIGWENEEINSLATLNYGVSYSNCMNLEFQVAQNI